MPRTVLPVPRLRAWRDTRLLTQQELAVKAGTSIATIARIERGEPANVRTIRALAAALDVSLDELIGAESNATAAGQRA